MMRYQRVSSPDVLPLSNGRKPGWRTCKGEDADDTGRTGSYSPFETKAFRSRSGFGSTNPSPTRDYHSPQISCRSDSPPPHSDTGPPPSSASSPSSACAEPAKAQSQHQINGVGHGGGGDVLLRWGQKKRSRGPRTEARGITAAAAAADESPAHSRSAVRVQRRSSLGAASAVMPPPCGLNAKGAYLRPCTSSRAAATGFPMSSTRGAEERSGGLIRSEKRSPQHPLEKAQRTSGNGGPSSTNPDSKLPSDLDNNGAATEKPNLDHFEWPRIYISLSRKEKEDDFLAMKGTKLPQRPKKRAKNIDRALQYCFPGMWLSDLTRGRYEVREKKCVKKKRRGLKGMESSDSE